MTPRSLFAALPLLTACGSESSGSSRQETVQKAIDASKFAEVDQRCTEITGGATAVEFTAGATCPGCTAMNEAQAIDGSDDTFAGLVVSPGLQGPVTLRATAQEGVVFPAGNIAGVSLSAAEGERDLRIAVATYLDGVMQEQNCQQSLSVGATESSRQLAGVNATKPFDALEVTIERLKVNAVNSDCGSADVLSINNPGDLQRPAEFRVHEFCSHFDLNGL